MKILRFLYKRAGAGAQENAGRLTRGSLPAIRGLVRAHRQRSGTTAPVTNCLISVPDAPQLRTRVGPMIELVDLQRGDEKQNSSRYGEISQYYARIQGFRREFYEFH